MTAAAAAAAAIQNESENDRSNGGTVGKANKSRGKRRRW